jgi:polyribonucleotide nucleotidyltransferase
MNEAIIQEVSLPGGRTLRLETGRLAKQADGAVVVSLGDTMSLCTAVLAPDVREGQNFFPLTVDYREKYAAGGMFPGGFIKREGRPTDKDVLTSRLIDRTIRPLFPDGFRNEVQVLCSTLSADPEIDADAISGVGASAALHITGAPFDGPTAHVRVGRVDGEFVVYPTKQERESSDFDLVVAGKAESIVMVEGEMNEVSEEDMVAALEFAHEQIKPIVAAIRELRSKVEEKKGEIAPFEYETVAANEDAIAFVHERVADQIREHLKQPYEKSSFYGGIKDIRDRMLEAVAAETQAAAGETVETAGATSEGGENDSRFSTSDLKAAYKEVESRVMRQMILEEGVRLDGRKLDEVRDIWSEVGYLPRVHGSAIFTRGETQALVSTTLGTGRDSQDVDQIFDDVNRQFYLQYNFPPFSTGEAKFLRGPGRREIGHGYLAERALKPVIPSEDEFPYVIRVVSETLESNGSSSMAAVCGGTLSLMDAGVPIKKPVAGIAMGLIEDTSAGEPKHAVLSDILGTEDHLGDMDFKVTGTKDGITACQMDIKISGLSQELMARAMRQAKEGRLHILGEMAKTLEEPRAELSPSAPRLIQIMIDQEFIGAVIGPGGKIIRGLQADTGAQIDIDEREGKGFVTIAARSQESADAAIEAIKGIVSVPEPGERYEGTVRKLLPFGAILEILPGKEAMLHVSEMAHGYVNDPADLVQVGDKLEVELIEVRNDGKLRLSRKPFLPEPTEEEKEASRKRREERSNDRGDDDRRGGGRGRGNNRRR